MSMYENPFTKRCTCTQLGTVCWWDRACPVHGDPDYWRKWRENRDHNSPEKRAENAEKYKSVQIGKVRHG